MLLSSWTKRSPWVVAGYVCKPALYEQSWLARATFLYNTLLPFSISIPHFPFPSCFPFLLFVAPCSSKKPQLHNLKANGEGGAIASTQYSHKIIEVGWFCLSFCLYMASIYYLWKPSSLTKSLCINKSSEFSLYMWLMAMLTVGALNNSTSKLTQKVHFLILHQLAKKVHSNVASLMSFYELSSWAVIVSCLLV